MFKWIKDIFILIIGVIVGAFVVKQFNVPDTVINGKNKVKKGGVIDFKAIVPTKKKRLFKRKK